MSHSDPMHLRRADMQLRDRDEAADGSVPDALREKVAHAGFVTPPNIQTLARALRAAQSSTAWITPSCTPSCTAGPSWGWRWASSRGSFSSSARRASGTARSVDAD